MEYYCDCKCLCVIKMLFGSFTSRLGIKKFILSNRTSGFRWFCLSRSIGLRDHLVPANLKHSVILWFVVFKKIYSTRPLFLIKYHLFVPSQFSFRSGKIQIYAWEMVKVSQKWTHLPRLRVVLKKWKCSLQVSRWIQFTMDPRHGGCPTYPGLQPYNHRGWCIALLSVSCSRRDSRELYFARTAV